VPTNAISNYPISTKKYEIATNLIDREESNKWCAGDGENTDVFTKGIYVDFKFSVPVDIRQYEFKTANDYPGRDPSHWEWHVSNDKIHWKLLATETFPNPPMKRYSSYGLLNIHWNKGNL